jgi:hypothetical protein
VAATGDAAYAPTAWGSSTGAVAEDITCPSGQRCLARRPGAEGLLRAGVIHDLDFLSTVVEEKHIKRVQGGKPNVKVEEILKDPEKVDKLVHMLDRVICYVVIKPELVMTPNDVTSRKSGIIYTDMVELDDKLFLMNYAVGGTRDLERFRRELDESVASVGAVTEDEVSAE